jgi:hypothetical protein
MAIILPLLLLCLIGASCGVPARRVEYFPGRSGDIIIQPDSTIHEDSAILLDGAQFASLSLKEIEDIRVADLISHVTGVQPFNILADRQGFPTSSLFEKPKATLLFALDSVGAETLAKHQIGQDFYQMKLTTQSFPPNTASLLTNVATGVPPSVHGIVGESWRKPNGEHVLAYQQADGMSLASGMADVITQQWAGASLAISASASATLAASMAPHPQLATEHPTWNIHGYYLHERKIFSSIYPQNEHKPFLGPTQAELREIISSPSFASFLTVGGKVEYSNDKLRVTLPNPSVSAEFDLTTTDFSIFAELAFVYNLLTKIKTDSYLSSLVSDSAPDFIAFVFSSLKDIKLKYGEESSNFAVGLSLVDCIIHKAMTALHDAYGGRVMTVVACLNTYIAPQSGDTAKQVILNHVRSLLHQEADFEIHYPSVFVRRGVRSTGLCTTLQGALAEYGATVHCLASSSPAASAYWLLDDGNNTKPNTTIDDSEQVAAFHLVFWMSIVLVLFVFAGVYGVVAAGTEATKDSLLYRATGRHHHQS